jgi:enoyl-[acyl-carrier protein] reductase II
MAWVATAELVAAVSNAGGLGIIGTGNSPPEWVLDQINAVREHTDAPFGVNVMLMSPYAREVVAVVAGEKVKVITTGAGNPGVYVAGLKEAGVMVIPVVASVALARRLERQGVDALIAEGMESGGHIGETATMPLVPQVVEAVEIPVIAAGGIATGRGLVAALALGAAGVQIGTRFVCSDECIAHPNFKQKIVAARDRSTVVTGMATGHPVRCLENRLAKHFLALEKEGAPPEELEQLGAGKSYEGLLQGNTEEGSLMAGQIAGLIKDIKSVSDIVQEIMAEAEEVITQLSALPQKENYAYRN